MLLLILIPFPSLAAPHCSAHLATRSFFNTCDSPFSPPSSKIWTRRNRHRRIGVTANHPPVVHDVVEGHRGVIGSTVPRDPSRAETPHTRRARGARGSTRSSVNLDCGGADEAAPDRLQIYRASREDIDQASLHCCFPVPLTLPTVTPEVSRGANEKNQLKKRHESLLTMPFGAQARRPRSGRPNHATVVVSRRNEPRARGPCRVLRGNRTNMSLVGIDTNTSELGAPAPLATC